jgi:hypothetical protein
MTILDRLIDRTGNWNPQLFRELKQRLTPRNIGVATGLSLAIQGFIWFLFYNQLPVVDPKVKDIYSQYCKFKNPNNGDSSCLRDAAGNISIDWQHWSLNIFVFLSWILPLGLLIGSVYLLTADLIEEEKRGTLNFIRLSPRSAVTIFLGKILGVPILIYLATALAVPFHFIAGINGGGNIGLLLGWYLTILAIWFLLSSISILYVLLGGSQTIAIVVLIAFTIGSPLGAINAYAAATIRAEEWLKNSKDIVSWYWLPILSNAIWFYAFCIGICIGFIYWVWQALERRYLNPTATILSKLQSYQINLCSIVGLAGFVVSIVPKADENIDYSQIISGMAIYNSILISLLIPILLPAKQALQDWSRYRATRQQQKIGSRELVRDLLINDKSPTLLAIAINLSTMAILWLCISLTKTSGQIKIMTVLYSATSLIMIYAAIAHLALFLNVRKRNTWTAGIIGVVMLFPITAAAILYVSESTRGLSSIIQLFSPAAPFVLLTSPNNVSNSTILFAFAAQFILLVFLTLQLQRRLKVVERSRVQDTISTMQE